MCRCVFFYVPVNNLTGIVLVALYWARLRWHGQILPVPYVDSEFDRDPQLWNPSGFPAPKCNIAIAFTAHAIYSQPRCAR